MKGYDRIYCSNNLKVEKYSKLFDKSIKDNFKWLSDHDALQVTLSIINN